MLDVWKGAVLSCRVLYVSLFCFTAAASELRVFLDVNQMGQGQCCTIRAIRENEQRVIMVDGGSSSFLKEQVYYRSKQIPSTKARKNTKTRTSNVTTLDIADLKMSTKTPLSARDIKENLIKNLRLSLGDRGAEFYLSELSEEALGSEKIQSEDVIEKTQIDVQTVLISHPDIDHYAWLPDLFGGSDDFIENIILGGLPEDYDVANKIKFWPWLESMFAKGTRIFIPALTYRPFVYEQKLDSSRKAYKGLQEEVSELSKDCQVCTKPYAACLHADPEKPFHYLGNDTEETRISESLITDALKLDKELEFSVLAFNPSHFNDYSWVMRHAGDASKNDDSLVVKVKFGESSALIMGDANARTMSTIYNRYRKHPAYLKADILVAAHHGSAHEGCNNAKLIRAVRPRCVLLSCGLSHGHPAAVAYENFKASRRMDRTAKSHKVIVGPLKDEKDSVNPCKHATLHLTINHIYSTLNSGDLHVELYSGTNKEEKKRFHLFTQFDLECQKTGKREEKSKGDGGENDMCEDIEIVEKGHKSNSSDEDSIVKIVVRKPKRAGIDTSTSANKKEKEKEI